MAAVIICSDDTTRAAHAGPLLPWAALHAPNTSCLPLPPFSPWQIDAASLMAASVMAAPCALALSKLVYPEVEESKFKSKEGVRLTQR